MIPIEVFMFLVILLIGITGYVTYLYLSERIDKQHKNIQDTQVYIDQKVNKLREYFAKNSKCDQNCNYDIEIEKIEDKIKNDRECWEEEVHRIGRDITDLKIDYVVKINEYVGDLKVRIDILEQKIKDGIQANTNCCKANIEVSNRESWRFDERLRQLERAVFTKETKNDNGDRVISVVVPNLEKVPSVLEPLGNGRKDNVFDDDSDENFYIKSDVEKQLAEKYPDFDEIMTENNIRLLKKVRPDKARWLSKIVDLKKKGEETYLAIKRMKSTKSDI